MVTWDDVIQNCKDLTGDTTSASETFFKRLLNTGYHNILAKLNRPNTELTQTASTVANQQYYQLPSNALFVKSVQVTVSSIPYPLEEIVDQDTWDALNADLTNSSDIPTFYFVRPGFGVNGTEIGLFPKPASAGNTITAIYEAGSKDLTATAYTTGTVTLADGDATVTGSGTTFTAAMVGRYFKATNDGNWYRIASFTDTTHLELENVFEGTSAAGLAYTINEAFALPEEIQILPVYYALQHYFHLKHNKEDAAVYKSLFESEVILAKRRWANKSRGAVIQGKPKFTLRNPNHPPGTIT